MVYRYSWIAGAAGLLFAFAELNGLLRPSDEGIPWQVAVAAAAILGAAITWVAVLYRLHPAAVLAVNGVALLVVAGQVAAPGTGWGIIPGPETFRVLHAQLDQAASVIRSGIEPVLPLTGIIVILMAVFWTAGVILAWGLSTGHPYVALIPPLVLTLQFTTMNRDATSLIEVAAFVGIAGWSMLAAATDDRQRTPGRMAAKTVWPPSEPGPSPTATALVMAGVLATTVAVGTLQDRVPFDGVLNWRNQSGLTGGFYGSVSYNPFVSIQQQLVSGSDTPVFQARITGDLPPDEVYFQLITMETYNGGQFFAFEPRVAPLEQQPYEAERHAFAGPGADVGVDVTIEGLRQDWLPSTYSVQAVDGPERLLRRLRARNTDSAIILEGGLSSRGMTYQLDARVPQPDAAALATLPNGQLSPTFALADAANDAAIPAPLRPDEVSALRRSRPPDAARYLALPDSPEARVADIATLAEGRTSGLQTNFEKGLALEAWFHSEAFRYRLLTEAEVGHGASDLAAWLLDADSPNFHQGYCENFATAMAVMARTLDIPSRVVLGFTPGTPRDDDPSVVVVRDANAHAWVELWIPNQGWVRFDPTPRSQGDTPQTYELLTGDLGLDLTDFLDVPPAAVSDFRAEFGSVPLEARENILEGTEFDPGLPDLPTGPDFSLPSWFGTAALWIAVAVVLLGAVPGVKWWRRRRRLERLRNGDITAAWEDIIARLDDLGTTIDPTATPVEVARAVDPELRPLAAVYGRAVYGPPGSITTQQVNAAQRSFDEMHVKIQNAYSPLRRFAAWYRIGRRRR